jgi:hypothetical protein
LKLKEYKKLKNQKKLSEIDILKIYKNINDSNEQILFLNSILNFDIFKIKAEFLIKTANKINDIYIKNGNYEKYKEKKAYTNNKYRYSVKKIGYLKLIKSEIFEYKFKDENNENFQMINVLEFIKN